MNQFESLIGEWHGEGEIPIEPPMKISVEVKIERMGAESAGWATPAMRGRSISRSITSASRAADHS